MNENLLQYIWKHKLFTTSDIRTVSGDSLSIISVGVANFNSGPDYMDVRIKINNTIWVGAVEIHLKSSDWNRHKHQQDNAYSNVILHVVYEHDKEVYTKAGVCLPTLELKSLVNHKIIETYKSYMTSSYEIACRRQFCNLDSFRLFSWLDRLLIERLEEKTQRINRLLEKKIQHKEEVFYHFLAAAFGFKTNALPFSLLAESLPVSCLAKQKDNLLQIEAMLFGQADLLPENGMDDYTNALKTEYAFLKRKFSLKPLCQSSMWKFAKLYPSGFPTVRIAQFAALIYQLPPLSSKVLHIEDVKELAELIELFTVKASDYWKSHYHFGKTSTKSMDRTLAKSAVCSLLINAVLPFLYARSQWEDNQTLQNKVIGFYEFLPLEKNGIVRKFTDFRSDFSNALHSQSLIQLYNKYCDSKQCLHCGIGIYLMSDYPKTDNEGINS
jgi:hypothetical protein